MLRSFIAVPVFALASVALVACGDDEKSSGGGRAATAVEGDAFCVQATEVDALMANMATLFGGDPAASEAALTALIDEATKAEALAPTDIVDVLKVSVQGFRDLATGLEKYDWDINAAAADPKFAALLESAEQEKASTSVESYLSEKCGIASS